MLKNKIIENLETVIKQFGVEGIVPDVEIPTDLSHGDYTTNIAFQLSKRLKKSPMLICQEIAEKLNISKAVEIEKIEAVKPGFINFWIGKEELINNMDKLHRAKVGMGIKGELQGKRIFVEYAHPNTHKEMHIGHMRTLITGEALCRLFEFQGTIVFRANYQGDIGPHVAKALYGIELVMKERGLTLEQIQKWSNYDKAHFLGEGYVRGNKEYDKAQERIDEINAILYQRRPGHYLSLYQTTRKWSLDYYEEFYARFMTKFDRLFFESEMVDCGLQIVKDNIGKLFVIDNGAVIFPGEKYGLHTRVFITQAGHPTYEGKEMCNGFTEYKAFSFDKKIHVVASEQSGYFQVVFKALELLDPQKFKNKQYHLPMGMVHLSDRKMSSRTGDILTVDRLIDKVKEAVKDLFKEGKINGEEKERVLEQICIGAIKYSVLRVGTKQDVAFDIGKSVSLEGDSGIYIQYSFARTQSILRKLDAKNIAFSFNDLSSIKEHDYNLEELLLLRLLFQFFEVAKEAIDNLAPNILCEYLFTLSKSFNNFYQKYRILDPESVHKKQLRISLTKTIGIVLKNGLYLLGIAAPEKM